MTQYRKSASGSRNISSSTNDSVVQTSRIPWINRLAQNFPVSVMVASPYLVIILPAAIIFENSSISFILMTLSLAVITTVSIELFIYLVDPFKRKIFGTPYEFVDIEHGIKKTKFLLKLGVVVLAIGSLTTNLGASLGTGTIESQIGLTAGAGPIGAVLTLFRSYVITGTALVILAHVRGQCSRKTLWIILGLSLLARIVYVAQIGITVQLWRYAIALALMLLLFGILKARHLLVILVIILVAWPTIYALRNESRVDRGVAVSSSVDALDRIRYDLQVTRAVGIEPGQNIGQPEGIEILRYGIIPGFLDSSRGDIATARLINAEILGGSPDSSYTFLPVATQYVLGGASGIILLYAFWAVGVSILVNYRKRITGFACITLLLIFYEPIGWFSIHPDSIIALMQNLVANIPVGLAWIIFKPSANKV